MIERTATLAALTATALIASLSANAALTAALVRERTNPPPVTYALVSETADGNVYVHDTGMTLDDCRARPDVGDPVQWCEVEVPRGLLIGFDCVGATGPLYARTESDFPTCGYIGRGN